MANNILIEYSKEGMRITHPSGVYQFLTLEGLHGLHNTLKEGERLNAQHSLKIHNHITEVEKHIQK